MNVLFQIVFALGYIMWIAMDYKKARKNRSVMVTFWVINIVTLALFVAISLNYRPPLPADLLNKAATSWAKSITGGIVNVQTSD